MERDCAKLRRLKVHYRIEEVYDANGIVTRWNPAAQTIFGWPEQEALGRPGSHFLVPFEQLELARTFFKSVSGTAGPGDLTRGPMEMTGVHRDGRRVPLEASWVAAMYWVRVLATSPCCDSSLLLRLVRSVSSVACA